MIKSVIAYQSDLSKGGLNAIELIAKSPFYFDSDVNFVKEQLAKIPTNRLRAKAAKEYAKRYNSTTAKNAVRSANIYIRKLVERVSQIINLSPLSIQELNQKKARQSKALQLSIICQNISVVSFDENTTYAAATNLVLEKYEELAAFAESQGVTAPYRSAVSSKVKKCDLDSAATYAEYAIRKMSCEKWWQRKLQVIRDQALEHLNITMGLVHKSVSPYASIDAVNEFRFAKKSQQEWLDSMQLENADGVTLNLADVFKGSVSNPEIRRIELMVRIRGCDEYAEQNGLDAVFYTVTAPSKFHANSEKYNNATPKQTQEFLTTQWAKVRATLAKQGVKLFGLRVCEPHHDATPHWHLLLFMRPEEKKLINDTIQHFAMQIDGDEKGASEHRFKAENIDRSKGSAVGYIAKYISKNINANHIEGEIDNETGDKFNSDSGLVLNVGAWSSRWRIRQFQFIGGAPVSVWRELRRCKVGTKAGAAAQLDECGNKLFMAADNSRYSEYLALMGGAFAKRAAMPLQVLRELDGITSYGEVKKRIAGVACGAFELLTRETRWSLKSRGSDATWSTENNCNRGNDWQINHGEKLNPLHRIPNEVRKPLLKGATYTEIDEQRHTITEFKFFNGVVRSNEFNYGGLSV